MTTPDERTSADLVAPVASEAAAVLRLRDVFDQLPAAVVVTHGPDHLFQFTNPVYRQLVARDDLEGLSAAEAMPELREQGFLDLLDHVLSTGEPFVGRETRRSSTATDEWRRSTSTSCTSRSAARTATSRASSPTRSR